MPYGEEFICEIRILGSSRNVGGCNRNRKEPEKNSVLHGMLGYFAIKDIIYRYINLSFLLLFSVKP